MFLLSRFGYVAANLSSFRHRAFLAAGMLDRVANVASVPRNYAVAVEVAVDSASRWLFVNFAESPSGRVLVKGHHNLVQILLGYQSSAIEASPVSDQFNRKPVRFDRAMLGQFHR